MRTHTLISPAYGQVRKDAPTPRRLWITLDDDEFDETQQKVFREVELQAPQAASSSSPGAYEIWSATFSATSPNPADVSYESADGAGQWKDIVSRKNFHNEFSRCTQ